MPEPVGIPDAVTDHALTGVTIDLLGTGIDHQGVEFLCRRGVIDRDVLETMPDVPVWQGDDLGLSGEVDLGDRFEQRLGLQDYLLVTDAFPSGTELVAVALAASMPVIEISPGQGIGLIVDSIADDRIGCQEGFPDLFVDRVAGEEPS